MILRVAFFVLMALGLLGFGTVAWLSFRPPPQAVAAPVDPPPIVKKMVLVAARPIHAGSLLKPEDLVAKELPVTPADGDVSLDTPDTHRMLVGALIRRGLSTGQMVRGDDVMRPGDHGFLAAVLDHGRRGITIGVDATSGSAGLIWPGDRVDVILTQSIADPTLPPGRRVAAETVLSNARVIAIDQQLVQGAAPSGNETQGRTVTLEVTPEQAELVSVAMRLGRLSLSVRAAGGSQPATADRRSGGPTWAVDVSPALATEAVSPANNAIRVFQGAGDVREFKF